MSMDTKTDYREIHYEVEEGRARITLARPKTHNAMTPRLLEELEHALWEADDDCAVHSVILKGEGPSFCSGYDLTALGRRPEERQRTGRSFDDDIWLIERNTRRIRSLWEMHKPTIAQVHGNCLAGGTDLLPNLKRRQFDLVLEMLAGRYADSLGRKRLFIPGVAIFAVEYSATAREWDAV